MEPALHHPVVLSGRKRHTKHDKAARAHLLADAPGPVPTSVPDALSRHDSS